MQKRAPWRGANDLVAFDGAARELSPIMGADVFDGVVLAVEVATSGTNGSGCSVLQSVCGKRASRRAAMASACARALGVAAIHQSKRVRFFNAVDLVNQLEREKRGLTYGVSSYFSPGLHAGSFTVGLQTRPD